MQHTARDFNHPNYHGQPLDETSCTKFMFKLEKSSVEITGEGRVSKRATMLLLSPSTKTIS